MNRLVVDTCVLMDMMFVHRARHAEADKMRQLLAKEPHAIVFPMHAHFEILSAAACDKKRLAKLLDLAQPFNDIIDLVLEPKAIDLEFVKNYFPQQFIDLKSGDMIFVGIALKESIPLVTEDSKMCAEAKRVGIETYTISEYVAALTKRCT
jgi:hypothetical protein